jgi:hypothetical protein
MQIDKENQACLANLDPKPQRTAQVQKKRQNLKNQGLREIKEEVLLQSDSPEKLSELDDSKNLKENTNVKPKLNSINLGLSIETDNLEEPLYKNKNIETPTSSFRKTPSRLSISIPQKEIFETALGSMAPAYERQEEIKNIRDLTNSLVYSLQSKLGQIENFYTQMVNHTNIEEAQLGSYRNFLVGMKNIVNNHFIEKFQTKVFIESLEVLEKFSNDIAATPGQIIYFFPNNDNRKSKIENEFLPQFDCLFKQSLTPHFHSLLFLEISLKNWGIDDSSLESLFENSLGNLTLLEHLTLDLSKNKLTDLSQNVLRNTLSNLRKPLTSLSLYLDYNQITNTGFKTLTSVFEREEFLKNLEEIQLGYSHNSLSSGGFMALGKTLFEGLAKANSIKKILLGFSHNAMTNQGVKVVIDGCGKLKRLEELYLEFYNNLIDEKGFAELIHPLACCELLRILKLDFGKNKIDSESLNILGDLLPNIPNLTQLKLYFDRCSISNVKTNLNRFFSGVQSLKQIEEIKWDLSYNDICSDFLHNIAEALLPNVALTLKSLALSLNHCARNTRVFTYEEVKYFLEECLREKVPKLQSVLLSIEGSGIRDQDYLIMILSSLFRGTLKTSFTF